MLTPRPVNDAQRALFEWLAVGGSLDPPRSELKPSAAGWAPGQGAACLDADAVAIDEVVTAVEKIASFLSSSSTGV